jgi:hypothetical protein
MDVIVRITNVRYDRISHDFMMLNPLTNTHPSGGDPSDESGGRNRHQCR